MATSPDAGAFVRLDRGRFFAALKPLFGASYTQGQVDGLNHLLDAFLAYALVLDRRLLAYVIATSFHETRRRMQPVREGFATTDAGARAAVAKLFAQGKISRNYALPNAKGRSFYGRGDVQLTHEDNYRRMGAVLGLPLADDPDLALDPTISKRILIEGVTRGASGKGDFSGKALEDYIHGDVCDYVGARRTVNGTDKAELIAGYARKAEAALIAGGMPLLGTRLPAALGAPAPVAVSPATAASYVAPAPIPASQPALAPAAAAVPAAGSLFGGILARLRAAYPVTPAKKV